MELHSKLQIHTSTTQYIGIVNCFTIPLPCGLFDMPAQEVWRRWCRRKFPQTPQVRLPNWPKLEKYPDDVRRDMQHWPIYKHGGLRIMSKKTDQVASSELDQASFTVMAAGRAEGQVKRHWTWMPSVWNMYFRTQVNLGPGLVWRASVEDSIDHHFDAARAAADLYKILESGHYWDSVAQKKRKIGGDSSKLQQAIGHTNLQRKIISDFSFRCRRLPGTSFAKRKIGHVVRHADLFYGFPEF